MCLLLTGDLCHWITLPTLEYHRTSVQTREKFAKISELSSRDYVTVNNSSQRVVYLLESLCCLIFQFCRMP